MSSPPATDASLCVASVRETAGRPAINLPIVTGIPLPRGYCSDPRRLTLHDADGTNLNAEITATALWPDRSLRWCLLRSIVDLDESEVRGLWICRDSQPRHPQDNEALEIRETRGELHLQLGQQQLRIDTDTMGLPDVPGLGLKGRCLLKIDGERRPGRVSHYAYRTLRGANGAFAAKVELSGHFDQSGHPPLEFRCALDLHPTAGGTRIDGSFTLHNPAAAEHPGGLWDLGDAHSAHFEALELGLDAATTAGAVGHRLRLTSNGPWQPVREAASITQYSSGGANWNSPVHVDALGDIPLRVRGYEAIIDGATRRGLRAQPQLDCALGSARVRAELPQFWEQFPSGLAISEGGLSLRLFPDVGTAHELQPGERKTLRFRLHLGSLGHDEAMALQHHNAPTQAEQLAEPQVIIDPAHVQRCELAELGNPADIDGTIATLIAAGVDGDSSFFSKRERIDEYGWRHFGDLYADHEAHDYQGERPFVSHYNNQYDALLGFLRQHLHSGDPRWMRLADDLAHHVVDIDIYHTALDRPEYNHGLFWHTDHYLPAETASHRAYSRRQPTDAYEGHAHGGGPGGQHCYTTGLLIHYLLTGDESSRDALYGLANWIERVYEGSGRLTDVLLAVKNRQRPDLTNHLSRQYPLDRGTANYLHALMDTWTLDQAPGTLAHLDHVIRHTVHPADDLAARRLHDVEACWHYVVFLQALCRFLELKASIGTADAAMAYARDSLLHYADWMVANEAPYLEKPEILEFPNHTWTAQDLRKANVLFYAARWAPEHAPTYVSKARHFVDYVGETLRLEPTRQYTRILALLMQNCAPTRPLPPHLLAGRLPEQRHIPPRQPGRLRKVVNLGQLAMRALRGLRPGEEISAARRLLPGRRRRSHR